MSKVQRKHKVGAVALIVMLVATIAFIYSSILGRSLIERPLSVEVVLEETGGLFEGSAVTYRGVRIGSVDELRAEGDAIVARIRIERNPRVPADTAAVVRSLSPVGEQYLDLRPASESGPYLANGDRITQVELPTSITDTLRNVDQIMMSINDENLSIVLHELFVATRDADALDRFVTAADEFILALDEVWPETEALIRDGRALLRIGINQEGNLRQAASSARDATEIIAAFDPQLRSFLAATPDQLESVRGLINVMGTVLPQPLADHTRLTQIAASHDPHLRELLRQFPAGLATLTSAFSDDALMLDLIVASVGEQTACMYGPDPGSPRTPRSERQDVTELRFCNFQEGDSPNERGAANAPGAVQ